MMKMVKTMEMNVKIKDGMNKYHDEFKLLKSDEERVKFTMKFLHGIKMLPELEVSLKDSTVSSGYKNEANKLYALSKKSQLDKIVELYTKSVAYAPVDSQELSIAYGNRSAALFHGRLYDECLKDIKRALDLDYPVKLRAKLIARKAQCLVVLGASALEIRETIQEAGEWLMKMDQDSGGRQLVHKILENPIIKKDFPEQKILMDDERELKAIFDENPDVRELSSAVEIKCSPDFGKYVAATRDIQPGEVITIARSYGAVLEPEKCYTNCSGCFKQTWSGIPCKSCVDVIYCSEMCRQDAWKDHHALECQLLGLFRSNDINDQFLLGIRMVIKALEEYGSIEKLRKKLEFIDSNRESNLELHENKYASVYTLATNSEKRSVENIFKASLASAKIVFLTATTKNNIFKKTFDKNFKILSENPSVTFIGGLILKNLQIISTNSFSVTDGMIDHISRGIALIPISSFYNHSCNPTCGRVFLGKTIVQFSISSIKKGEQIFENYGVHYALDDKSDRQNRLKDRYYFDCQCIACTENWQRTIKLPMIQTMKLPPKLKKIALSQAHRVSDYFMKVWDNDISNRKKMVDDIKNIIKFFQEKLPVPFRELYIANQVIRQIYILRGNDLQTLNDN